MDGVVDDKLGRRFSYVLWEGESFQGRDGAGGRAEDGGEHPADDGDAHESEVARADSGGEGAVFLSVGDGLGDVVAVVFEGKSTRP